MLNTNKCPPECCSELYELKLTDTLILQKQQLCAETDYSMYIRGLDVAQAAHRDFVEYLLEKTNTGYSKELVTFLHKSIKAVPAFAETAALLLKKALAHDFAKNSKNYQWNMELGHFLLLLPVKQRAEIALSLTMLRKCGLRNTYSEAKSLLICDNSQWEKSLLQSADMLNERASEIRQAGETFCKLLVKLHPDEYFDLLDYEQKCCLSAFIDDENMQQFKLQLQEEQDILTLLKKETDSVYTYLK